MTDKARLVLLPEGWVAVPKEPTAAMRLAGRKAPDSVEDLWPAMIAAAPSLPEQVAYSTLCHSAEPCMLAENGECDARREA